MVEIHHTDIDGVTTIWAETSAPLAAGLLFRTGRVDESVPITGWTHLIEHLAISATGNHSRHSNGLAAEVFTGFYTSGHPEDVVDFLQGVCKALANLPGERLEAEKQILAAENRSRGNDLRGNLLRWRYGAAGYGLIGFRDLGLRGVTLEQLQEFSALRFTRDNAILWVNGPIPKDLRVDLPPGRKIPLPPLNPVLTEFPSFFQDDGCGGLAVGATVPRVSAAPIFIGIAQNRLLEGLRNQNALSYSPSVIYDPLNAETAHLILYADSEMNRRAELVDAFSDVFEGFQDVSDLEVESTRKEFLDHMTGPLAPPPNDLAVAEIQRFAMDWLLGKEFETVDSLAAGYHALTATDITAFFSEVKQTSLAALPGQATYKEWAGERAPNSLAPRVKGREVKSVDYPIERIKLIHGPDGVSLKFPDASYHTVRYQDLAGAIHYDDGGVALIGNDATWLTIEPTLWRKGRSVAKSILEHVPVDLLLDHGERSASQIPKPQTTAWQRFIASLT